MSNHNHGERAQNLALKQTRGNMDLFPRDLEEFIEAGNLEDWPLPLPFEKFVNVNVASRGQILQQLTDATPVDMKLLTNLEDNLESFNDKLGVYASKILVIPDPEDQTPEQVNKEPRAPVTNAFMTDVRGTDAVRVHPSRKSKRKMDFKDSLQETKKKTVQHCVFPGFHKTELTELPCQLEAPQILNRVTKALGFNAGFKKFWKKIFQSEASVAIMQDTFWWIFIDNFQENKSSRDKNHFFDRIADSTVALFTSIHPEFKDKFFEVYSDCLAQAVFAVYIEAFPESERFFGDDFKTRLLNVISEWFTGTIPPPKKCQTWKLERLKPKVYKVGDENQTQAAKILMDNSSKEVSYTLDTDDFKRAVARLGKDGTISPSRAATPKAHSREAGQRTGPSAPVLLALPSTSRFGTAVSRRTEHVFPKRISSQALLTTKRKDKAESHQVGPGPELQRTLFNLHGRSPLVAHYLRMHHLIEGGDPGRRVRRTEINKLPDKGVTYKQVIEETIRRSEAHSKEYEKIRQMTNLEIAKTMQRQREMNRNINKLQQALMLCKSSAEVKNLKESIFDKAERDTTLMTSVDKGRGSDNTDV